VAGQWLPSRPLDDAGPKAAKVDTTVAHIARVDDYWLGGRDNYAVDRIAAERVIAAFPDNVRSARGNRAFLGRAVRYLVREAGVRQFLDIGTGLPTADNTHEVAQRVAPESRIVYVDNDPLVLVHARALLTSDPRGVTAYIDADLHDPDKILAEAAATLDFSQPVAVIMLGVPAALVPRDRAEDAFGRVDVVFANAGIGTGSGLDAPDEIWERTWGVNVNAHVLAARRLVPGWLERGQGRRRAARRPRRYGP